MYTLFLSDQYHVILRCVIPAVLGQYVAYETEYCILGVMFHIVYGVLLIARFMCSVLYTLLCYYCIL